jgi:hypothetical protein
MQGRVVNHPCSLPFLIYSLGGGQEFRKCIASLHFLSI